MRIERTLKSLVAATVMGLATVCGAAAQSTELILADIYADDHSNTLGAREFAKQVEEKTGGTVTVNVFPNSTVGNEREIAESIIAGTVDIGPNGLITRFVPALQILELPYLYRDVDHMQRVAAAIAPKVQEMFQAQGVENLGYFFLGPRSVAGTRPIRNFKDFEGFRLRVPELPLYVGMTRALGGVPTPVPFGEAYTSLETGVAEGAEGEPATLFTQKLHEPARFVSLTKHIYHFRFIAMNRAKFQSLTPEQQQALHEAAKAAQDFQVGVFVENNNKAIEQMRADGAEIVETEGLDEFAKAVASFHDDFAADLGPEAVELLKMVKSVE